jgi:hypothetical protein
VLLAVVGANPSRVLVVPGELVALIQQLPQGERRALMVIRHQVALEVV